MGMRVPQSWKEVSINKFLNIRAALEMRDVDKLDRNVFLAAAILGKSVDWVEDNMTLEQIGEVIRKTTFAAHLPQGKPRKLFYLSGKLWVVELQAKNILPAQLIDLTALTQTPESTIENTARIMATICRPAFRKYNSDKVDEYAKLFGEKLRFDIAHNTALFFCELYTEFLVATNDYLQKLKQMKTHQGKV